MTYLHPDHLGTPKFGTNAGGTQVWAWAPDAFGGGSPSGGATVNLRMPGQFFDAESSLFYNWNRYYNPATGRYISSDPIGLEGGINTFLYAAASPVMFSDPTGEAMQLFLGAGYVGYTGYRGWQAWRAATTAKKAIDVARAARALSMATNDPNEKAGTNASSDAQEKTCPTGGPEWPGDDPSKGPAGTEWRGKPGSSPGGKDGNFYNPDTKESYRPDLSHPEPIGKHWDYRTPEGTWYRIFLDGTILPK